jgi:hypothetical protein
MGALLLETAIALDAARMLHHRQCGSGPNGDNALELILAGNADFHHTSTPAQSPWDPGGFMNMIADPIHRPSPDSSCQPRHAVGGSFRWT